MAKYLLFDSITLKPTGCIDPDESGMGNIPDNYIEVSDGIYDLFSKNPDWIWNGEKPVPPSEAPPLTQKQIELIRERDIKAIKLKKQTEEIYIEYGKFIVMFEHMVETLRSCIINVFMFNQDVERDYIEILLNGFRIKDYTAKINAIYCLIYPDDEQGKLLVKNLLKKINDLNEQRNKVVHGLWYIGFCGHEDADFSEATLIDRKLKKGALYQSHENHTAEKLKILFKEAAKLHGLIGRLAWCLKEPSPGKTQRNISQEMIDSGGGFRSLYHPKAPIWDEL